MEAIEQWLAVMRKSLDRNYRRLDDVLVKMQRETKGEK
jgi:hypothetical protein